MTVLRATAKLLKRLRQAPPPGHVVASTNPLGEWYGDVFFVQREPVVLMLNSQTCAALLLPGRAADLRQLGPNAALQFEALLRHFDLVTATALREVAALRELTFARTADRSLVSLMSQRKFEAWMGFNYHDRDLTEAAAHLWDTPFSRKGVKGMDYAIRLVREAFPAATSVQAPVSLRGT